MSHIEGHGGTGKLNFYQKTPPKSTELANLKDELAAFKEIDADKNGKLSKDELKAADGKKSKMFLEWDANDNGSVSWNEVAKGNSFMGLDADKDGKLTGAEAEELKAYDGDGNGEVSREEYLKGRKAEMREIGLSRRANEFKKLDGNQDGELTGTELEEAKQYDADKDGKVTKDEFMKGRAEEQKKEREEARQGRIDKLLESADKNDDGYLSGNEIKKGWAQYDADKDGKLSKDELAAVDKAERTKRWEDRLMGADVPETEDKKDKDQPKTENKDKTDKKDKTEDKDKKDKVDIDDRLKSPYV